MLRSTDLGLVHNCELAENSKEVTLGVEATADIKFDAIRELFFRSPTPLLRTVSTGRLRFCVSTTSLLADEEDI